MAGDGVWYKSLEEHPLKPFSGFWPGSVPNSFDEQLNRCSGDNG
jgi:hypothetical protein